MNRKTIGWIVLGCVLLAPASALAKRNRTDFALEFIPQQTIAGSEPGLNGSTLGRPVGLELIDGRNLEDESEIGKRTDDDDDRYTLRATNEVIPFVNKAIVRAAKDWGFPISASSSELTLQTTLRRFHVAETNQAVGATFKANVSMAAKLTDSGGTVLWSGSGDGDATRYGRKFSSENCNEVLSDAILEAWSDLLSAPGLGKAWRGKGQ